jgi:hypothetical protein
MFSHYCTYTLSAPELYPHVFCLCFSNDNDELLLLFDC